MTVELEPRVTLSFADLAAACTGKVVTPLDVDWDRSRLAWNLAIDQRPAAVVFAESVADVVAVMAFGARHGLQVAPQATGHNAGPLGDLSSTILLRTDRMDSVFIDVERQTARIGAGVLWADVVQAAAIHGLAALAGSAADVGVTGYTLGGGVSWLARSHGLASGSVTAIEVVTADGRQLRCTPIDNADLFYALCGGGGSYAIVTALEFQLYPIASVEAGILFWPLDRAGDVLPAWRDWTRTLPNSVMSVGRVLQFPPLPELPPHLSGQSFVIVEAVIQESAEVAARLLEPMRAMGPAIDTFQTMRVADLQTLHMDPPSPVPAAGDGMVLNDLTDEAIATTLATLATPAARALLTLEFRHLEGALTTRDEDLRANPGFEGRYLMFAAGIAATPELGAMVNQAVDQLMGALAPFAAARTYLNFVERPAASGALFGDRTEWLRLVKRTFDPQNRIRANHAPDA